MADLNKLKELDGFNEGFEAGAKFRELAETEGVLLSIDEGRLHVNGRQITDVELMCIGNWVLTQSIANGA